MGHCAVFLGPRGDETEMEIIVASGVQGAWLEWEAPGSRLCSEAYLLFYLMIVSCKLCVQY